MQLYTTRGFADIDFSADSVQIVKPTMDVLARTVALDDLPASERMQAKERIFQDFLEPQTLEAPGRNAILDEQNDFAISVKTGTAPVVTGEDGARAVDLANRIVSTISQHGWDGLDSKPWRVGPLATAEPRILPHPAVVRDAPQETRRRAA